MLKKRIIGMIIVKDGWAVQSFAYGNYLPLGRPETLAKNLDRWGADEIGILCIDRSLKKIGPDFELLRSICSLNLTTPISYGGGIRDSDDAKRAVEMGCERIILESAYLNDPDGLNTIADTIGKQALIASIPLSFKNGTLSRYSYSSGENVELKIGDVQNVIDSVFSELLIIDKSAEGSCGAFNPSILEEFRGLGASLIAFGGVFGTELISRVLAEPDVSAVAVGNFLNYSEQTIYKIKNHVGGSMLRQHKFRFNRDFTFGRLKEVRNERV